MKQIKPNDPETRSADLVQENLDRLKAMFPEAFVEGKVDFEVLKQLLGGAVETRDEKYGLNWHGKRMARQLALTPSTGTLRPCPEESVDWHKTQNLMIEGDNLEVLKLLQKSYSGRVKLIYIDPPYNTGKDFVYPDNFHDSIANYLRITGQAGTTTNTESSGRFHTDWLNMMLPRLRLARTLLRDDGVVVISIDDGELANLVHLCSEVFGEENFVGIVAVLVNPRGRHLDKFLAQTHDNLVVFAKDASNSACLTGMAKDGAMLEEYDREDARGRYRELGLRNRNQAFNPTTRPTLFYPLYIQPATGRIAIQRDANHTDEVFPVTADGVKTCWTWSREKVVAENNLLGARKAEDGSWRVYRKDYLLGEDGQPSATLAKSVWLDKEFNNDYGRKAVKDLFGVPVMDFPKSPHLLEQILTIGSGPDDIVLDFFAGSATTGHATYSLNAAQSSRRRFILVQLPESTRRRKGDEKWEESPAWQAGYKTIAEVAKERLRRSATQVRTQTPMFAGDLGFRVYRLDSSNIRQWAPASDSLSRSLFESVEHIASGRTSDDILCEIIIKLGLDLCVPVDVRSCAGKDVYSVGAGTLFACLGQSISRADAEALAAAIVAWHAELAPATTTTVVFRDSAFVDDVAKSNLVAILEQNGLTNVRSL